MTPKWAALCKPGLLFYQVGASMSNRLTLKPLRPIDYSDLFLPPDHANAPQMALPSSLLGLSCPTLPLDSLAFSLTHVSFTNPCSCADGGFSQTINQRLSFVLETCHSPSMLSLSADHSAARGGPGVLGTHGISVQNVFFALLPPSLEFKA